MSNNHNIFILLFLPRLYTLFFSINTYSGCRMLTLNQKKRLAHNSIGNIHDMSLLSLMYQKPTYRGFPIVYRPSWWYKSLKPTIPKTAIFLPGMKIQYDHVQTSFVKYFVTLNATKKIDFVKECLVQVAKMLSNMDYYVHGDLTIENIMVSYRHRYQFYITDRCIFERKKYCDLRTLYISIMELFEEPIPPFFNIFTNIVVFDPVLFLKHTESI